jgi:hypothetical protein
MDNFNLKKYLAEGRIHEITQSGQEGVYPMSEEPGDMFQQKEVEELFPIGMASRDDKSFKDKLAQHGEWTEQSQYNNTFVHFQYHTIPDFNGNSYHVHQGQHYNHNYDDFRSPRFTVLTIIKNYDTPDEERLGEYIVGTEEYLDDIRNLDAQDLIGKRVSEGLKENKIRISQQAADLVDGYELEDLERNLEQIYRDMEQEAEPEGGPIADQYADEIHAHEEAIRFIKSKGKEQAQMSYDVAVGKITQDEYDTIVSKDQFNKSSKFDRVKENTPDNQLADKILSDAMKVLADDDYFDPDYPGGDIAANGSPYLQFDTEDQAEQAFNILVDHGIEGVLVGDIINLTKAMVPFMSEDKENKPMSDEELEDLETRADDYYSEPIKENKKMKKFNLKSYLKEGKLLKENEEKTPVSKIKDAIEDILKKEGGAAGLKPILAISKELGVTRDELKDVLNSMGKVKKHTDGDYILTPIEENTAYLDGKEVDYSNIDLYSDIDRSWSSLDIMEEDLLDWFKASAASMGKEGAEEIIQSIRSLNNAMVQHLRTLNEAKDDDWIQKGEESGEIKAGGLHKALGIPEDEKIPIGLINKELAKLKKKDKDKGEKGVQGLSAADRKFQKQLNLAKSFKKMDENQLNEAPDIMDLSAKDLMSARFGYKHGLSGGDLGDLKKIINKFVSQANRMRRPKLSPDELGDVFNKIVSNFL